MKNATAVASRSTVTETCSSSLGGPLAAPAVASSVTAHRAQLQSLLQSLAHGEGRVDMVDGEGHALSIQRNSLTGFLNLMLTYGNQRTATEAPYAIDNYISAFMRIPGAVQGQTCPRDFVIGLLNGEIRRLR